MLLDMREYMRMIKRDNISIVYSGPMWEDGIKGIAEMVKLRLHNEMPGGAAKAVFSVFVEQVTNMLMYTVEKTSAPTSDNDPSSQFVDLLVLGYKGNTYFIQTGNTIKAANVEIIKSRIDHLNSLDKSGLRQYHKERLNAENDNPESKGAGLGLIEIARRASAPLEYTFEQINEALSYFTMYVEIEQGR